MEISLNQPFSFYQIGGRSNQEDARYPDCDTPQGAKPVFIVCDGVGGQEKGEVASLTVAETLGNFMSRVDLTKPFTLSNFAVVLNEAYEALNKKASKQNREMATTLTFVCFHEGGVLCAHIGDSRIYHVRPGAGILYRSDDHSLVNALVHSGEITPEEALNHPMSNIITRCLTCTSTPEDRAAATAVQITDVEAGDYFFLCSDGVLHEISDNDLYDILSAELSDREKIDIIARESAHSSDNNTAILVPVAAVTGGKPQAFKPSSDNSSSGSSTSPLTHKRDDIAVDVSPHSSESSRKSVLSRFLKDTLGLGKKQ